MLDVFRIQASAGPVTDKALEEIVFRAEHGILQSLTPHPGEQRVAMLPSVVRMLLTVFIEELARSDSSPPASYNAIVPIVDAPRPGYAPASVSAVACALAIQPWPVRDRSEAKEKR
jgi:hypothetical protein